MESLTLEQAYYIGELIAAFAVFISLIYVGIQLKQNTRAMQLDSLHNITEELREIYSHWGGDANLSEILLRGSKGLENIEGSETMQYFAAMHGFFRGMENAFYQWKEGALDSKFWYANVNAINDMCDTPGIKGYWNLRKHWYTEDFQQFIEKEAIAVSSIANYKMAGT